MTGHQTGNQTGDALSDDLGGQVGDHPGDQLGDQPPLVLIRGEATDEEVAAVTAVVTALTAAHPAVAPTPPVSQWASRARAVRPTVQAGPGGWRASSLPR